MLAGKWYCYLHWKIVKRRGGSKTPATSRMELFGTICNDWKPQVIATKNFILYLREFLHPPLSGSQDTVKHLGQGFF